MKIRRLLLAGLMFFAVSTTLAADDTVVATVNDHNITEKEVMALAKQNMMKILAQMYEIKKAAADDLIDEHLLSLEAKKKDLTVEQLKKQIRDKVGVVSESEAQTIYQLQKKRFKDAEFKDVKDDLMAQLTNQKKQMALVDFVDDLRKAATITVNLERPRAEVSVDDDPEQGEKNAPVTLIEFSEFQCPYCKKTRPVIDRIMSEYKGKVRYVFRDFPLSFHEQAKGAANAANCAHEQGKYWEYNRKLWEVQGSQTEEKLLSLGTELKLNEGKFTACVKGKKYYKEIDADLNEGENYGVTGTPAYFINGVFLSGAQPYESFKELIDEELEKKLAQ